MSAAGGAFAHQAIAVSFIPKKKTKLQHCCVHARVTGWRDLCYLNLILFFAFVFFLRTLLASTIEACRLNICSLKLYDLDGGVWESAEVPHPFWWKAWELALGVAQNHGEKKSGIGQICRNIFLVPISKEIGPNSFAIEHASKQPKVYAQPSAKKANQSLRENFFHGPSWSVSSHRIHDPPRTRTWNLRLRRPTPYPLGQRAIIFERL